MKVCDMARVVHSLEALGYEVKINPDWYGQKGHTLNIKRKNCDKRELNTEILLQEEKSKEAV